MKSWFLLTILILGLLPGIGVIAQSSPQLHSVTLYNVTSMQGLDPKYYSFEAVGYLPPNETPVLVTVAKNLVFNDTAFKPYYLSVHIPNGSYSFILMNVSVKEVNGTQFDRPFYIFVDGIPVFWGSTQEIQNSSASVDLTMFENLLHGNVTFEPVLVNLYDAKVNITGLYVVNITLALYPGKAPGNLPNEFIPLFVNGTFNYNYSYVILNPNQDSYTSPVTIPNGTYRMTAFLYEEGGGLDEFWYINEPATRDILMYYNGLLTSVIPPYETIYTGGIDLFWWKPLPSINTLAFHTPYQIDLTPLLAMGTKANITVSITNLATAKELTGSPSFDWDLSGFLALWVNQSNPMISGKMVQAYSRFLDSSPIFAGGFSGVHYQEGGSYTLTYSSILTFLHGDEIATVSQSGKFYASQTFNNIYQFAYLDETFKEVANESGFYTSSMYLAGNYPVTMQISAFATPISSPNKIPFNLSYAQNGSVELGAYYSYFFNLNGYTTRQSLQENLTAQGGFSGIIEVINSYRGAVLVKLTSNNALTQKSLTFTYEEPGVTAFKENFLAEAGQNNSVNATGYYLKIQRSFTPLSGTLSGDPPYHEAIKVTEDRLVAFHQSILVGPLRFALLPRPYPFL
ncbi:hypothetical protein L3N51_00577 [Metallosphaera sp. J1]|uniref:peptide-N4-asparagine amidase n=1 Tax=Metallosphaera javensis (ex Hofmann et al. 2022) TaxID=99938 RepID=UPI001EDFA028|nr:peptide-N4-asparagine amidase [Metallosphaera javensis (ex Hofmann et al. 2022)]MCG3108296.1 hypothetical protein [Metallosphaera javensis (ex Hofmann et al. 2022)]